MELECDFTEEYKKIQDVIANWEEPEWTCTPGTDWMYDNDRSYAEQLRYYNLYRDRFLEDQDQGL